MGVSGQVVVGRQSHAARIAETDGEKARGVVQGVVLHVGGEEADWEPVFRQYVVGGAAVGGGYCEGDKREEEEKENSRRRH